MKRLLIVLGLLCATLNIFASQVPKIEVPKRKSVHITLAFEQSAKGINKFHYLQLQIQDLYSKEERTLIPQQVAPGVYAFGFDIYYPLYSSVVEDGDKSYPFYVEPGDNLFIGIKKNGEVTYVKGNGEDVKYENLLKYDISNKLYYGDMTFFQDKKEETSFAGFAETVMNKMSDAMNQVNQQANKYNFSAEERNIALSNVKMQMARWIFKYAPYKDGEQDANLANISNYEFMRRLPLADSVCLYSPFFPDFVKNYERTYLMNYDLSKYSSETSKDSALVARDLAVINRKTPSLAMSVALGRRAALQNPKLLESDPNYGSSKIDTTASIMLREVNVFGYDSATPEGLKISEKMMQDAKLNAANPNANLFGFIDLISKHKKKKKQERINKVLDALDGDSEADLIRRAYEETTGRSIDEVPEEYIKNDSIK